MEFCLIWDFILMACADAVVSECIPPRRKRGYYSRRQALAGRALRGLFELYFADAVLSAVAAVVMILSGWER